MWVCYICDVNIYFGVFSVDPFTAVKIQQTKKKNGRILTPHPIFMLHACSQKTMTAKNNNCLPSCHLCLCWWKQTAQNPGPHTDRINFCWMQYKFHITVRMRLSTAHHHPAGRIIIFKKLIVGRSWRRLHPTCFAVLRGLQSKREDSILSYKPSIQLNSLPSSRLQSSTTTKHPKS